MDIAALVHCLSDSADLPRCLVADRDDWARTRSRLTEANALSESWCFLLESVYADAMEAWRGHLDETYARLVQMEARVRAKIMSLCQTNHTEYVDGLPVLREAVQRHEPIYPSSTDGHPNPQGYWLLASALHKALSRAGGWLEPDDGTVSACESAHPHRTWPTALPGSSQGSAAGRQ